MAAPDILLGPILGYEWDAIESKAYYTVIVRMSGKTAPVWRVDGQDVPMKKITTALKDGSHVWRGEISLAPFTATKGKSISYSIRRTQSAVKNVLGKSSWSFYLPGKDEEPKIAFCSCNGFTDSKKMKGREPLAMWLRMKTVHEKEPFSLLLMGGDQLYCDDLAAKQGSLAKLRAWLTPGVKVKAEPSPTEFLDAYFEHYLLAWTRVPTADGDLVHTEMIHMMASVPSVMMWDDHDIFDGWGSYEATEKKQPYYTNAFPAAKDAFKVYQLRGKKANRSLLDRKTDEDTHFSLGLDFGPYEILLLDNRSNRTTKLPAQVMSEGQWEDVKSWLHNRRGFHEASHKTLLVVSPIPVLYRKFADWVSALPGEHGTEDDLRDHWNHKSHDGERIKLIAHLFQALKYKGNDQGQFTRITLLSGDVHVGALGFLERTDTYAEIAQVVSSAIIHPPPTRIEWAGILAVSNDNEDHISGHDIVGKMTHPVGAAERYLRCRNFVWLKEGTDKRLWINWECESLTPDEPERAEFGLRGDFAAQA